MSNLLTMDAERVGMGDLFTEGNLRAYLAELIGTMLFVAIGTATWIVVGGPGAGADAIVAIAIAHGFAYAGMVYMTANISGGHINPAVTLGMMVTRNIKIAPGLVYMVAQVVGGVVATAVLYLALNNTVGNSVDFGANGIAAGAVDGDGGALLLEIVFTLTLVMVFFAVAVSKRGFGHLGPLAIGVTVVAIYFVALPLTGASANPARTFGPALVSNAFDSFWVYVLGPAIGGMLGALIYYLGFFSKDERD
ncbi:MAG: aquaporin [Dehalococcoidia bacterium]